MGCLFSSSAPAASEARDALLADDAEAGRPTGASAAERGAGAASGSAEPPPPPAAASPARAVAASASVQSPFFSSARAPPPPDTAAGGRAAVAASASAFSLPLLAGAADAGSSAAAALPTPQFYRAHVDGRKLRAIVDHADACVLPPARWHFNQPQAGSREAAQPTTLSSLAACFSLRAGRTWMSTAVCSACRTTTPKTRATRSSCACCVPRPVACSPPYSPVARLCDRPRPPPITPARARFRTAARGCAWSTCRPRLRPRCAPSRRWPERAAGFCARARARARFAAHRTPTPSLTRHLTATASPAPRRSHLAPSALALCWRASRS
jgi:hypothetical protein